MILLIRFHLDVIEHYWRGLVEGRGAQCHKIVFMGTLFVWPIGLHTSCTPVYRFAQIT
jgi:hypothetical protein